MQRVVVAAPAKVNLQLSVGGPGTDGYHPVATVLHAVSVFDQLVAEPADDIELSFAGAPPAGVPSDAANLAVRAARLLAEHVGGGHGVHMRLTKRIPVAAGMAGGSADAAAALVACDALWGTGLPRAELAELAAELGADVPFVLHGGTAMGVGRGDRLSPVLARGTLHWVFAVADGELATPAVYAECDRLRAAAGEAPPHPAADPVLMAALTAGDGEAIGAALSNDLQPAAVALRPQLSQTLAAAGEFGVLGSVVSGSGPTVAFLVASPEAALDVAVGLTAMGLCRDVIRATGPAPGARVIGTAPR